MLPDASPPSDSPSLLLRGLHWLALHSRNALNRLFPRQNPLQPHQNSLLVFPQLAQNLQAARNYGLQRVRERLGVENNQKHAETVESRLRKSAFHWGSTRCVERRPDELICPICMDFLVGSVVTPCGHAFCWQCLDQAVLLSPSCPVCRANIRSQHYVQSVQLTAIIRSFLKRYRPEGSKCPELVYENRLERFEQWLSKRLVSQQAVNPSDLLDVRDTQYVWCSCLVRQILNIDGIMSLLVHYIGWSNVYDEVIEVNSQRLASYRFYTSRRDIPHYVLADNEINNLEGYVVERDIVQEEESDSSENRDSMEDIELQLMNEEESEDQQEEEQASELFQFTRENTRLEVNPEIEDSKESL